MRFRAARLSPPCWHCSLRQCAAYRRALTRIWHAHWIADYDSAGIFSIHKFLFTLHYNMVLWPSCPVFVHHCLNTKYINSPHGICAWYFKVPSIIQNVSESTGMKIFKDPFIIFIKDPRITWEQEYTSIVHGNFSIPCNAMIGPETILKRSEWVGCSLQRERYFIVQVARTAKHASQVDTFVYLLQHFPSTKTSGSRKGFPGATRNITTVLS